MKVSRREFLAGVGGTVAGGSVVALTDRHLMSAHRSGGTCSYAQSGEDLIVRYMLHYLRAGADRTYLDIGAYDPVALNNTYLFYLEGHRGVLVEPNPAVCAKLRAVRPRDRTLVAGIGVSAEREADYYLMSDPSWNTFSKDEAEHQQRITNGAIFISGITKAPLLNINDVMAEHFRGAPAFLSVDTQGLDLAILKTIDFERFRPKVICAETLITGTDEMSAEIPRFLETRGYVVRGSTLVNTLMVDAALIKRRAGRG